MKILLCWRQCFMGGVETWMLTLARTFRALGHQCELFFFKRGAFEQCIPPDVPSHFGDLAAFLRLVASKRFDIVHGATIDWELGITAVRRLGARLILTGNGWVRPFWNSANCDALVGCSKWNAKAQQSSADMPVHVVYNGIDVDRFHPPKEFDSSRPIVAWVGRGDDLRQKRIDRLAAIARHMGQRNIRLWVVDPAGPEKVPAEVAATLKPIADFWGPIAPRDMPDLFRRVAASGGCVLSTSSFEGLSLAYIEAQACGCPVIGTDVRGVNEGVDPKWGGVIYDPELSPEAVSRLVFDTLADKEGMCRRRTACREFAVQHFGIERTAQQYIRIYEQAISSTPKLVVRPSIGLIRSIRNRKNSDFLERHWSPGNRHFLALQAFLDAGELRLARTAAWSAVQACPSLFLRPRRLWHLVRAVWKKGHRADTGRRRNGDRPDEESGDRRPTAFSDCVGVGSNSEVPYS